MDNRQNTSDSILYRGYRLALRYHLTVTLYPSVDLVYLASVQTTIAEARRGHWHSVVTLPTGQTRTVLEIVKTLDLSAFVERETTPEYRSS